MTQLSILIPAKNEEFLGKTIQDILEHIEGDTEIIAVLDGYEVPIPEIPVDPRVRIIKNDISVGQRAATNQAARLSEAKYLMKVDAHCSFDQGFDLKMIREMHDDWTMVPIMRNLHAFDWVCPEGHRRYQSPSGPCIECGKETKKDIVWIGKKNPQSTSYCFDSEPHFQYFGEFKSRPEGKGDITETMSLQGSCFMVTRDKYWELNLSDESLGSWGSQGIEVACKTWLSGGRVVVNHKTWYAHMFRTQGGDFGFPYHNSGSAVEKAKKAVRELFFDNKWEKQVRQLSWLIEKFDPPDRFWSKEAREKLKNWDLQVKPLKGIIYYTDNKLKWSIAKRCRDQIRKSGLPIVSCSLKPAPEMGKNIVLKMERGYETMFTQILTALEASEAEIIYFCEHDVLYHPDHFSFTPKEKGKFYYNGNYWMIRLPDGFAIHYNVSPLSGLVGFRDELITHFRERLELIKKEGFSYNIGFEPMTHNRIDWKTKYGFEIFMPENPNIDISHEGNVTNKRWTQDEFRRKPTFWEESDIDHIKGWDNLRRLLL